MLSRLGPKSKPRRRSLPLRRYDQLVALAEANAQKRHDALYGPSLGAAQDETSTKPEASQDAAVEGSLDLHAMTSSLILGYGPGIGSPRRRLDELHDCERAARSSSGDAFSTRLLQRMPVGAEPGPKSGPCPSAYLLPGKGCEGCRIPRLRSGRSSLLSSLSASTE